MVGGVVFGVGGDGHGRVVKLGRRGGGIGGHDSDEGILLSAQGTLRALVLSHS
jgi:hypothetical protein